MTEGEPRRGGLLTAAAYALVLVLSVELAVWGAFLVPLRGFGVPLPAGPLVALVGNAGLGLAGTRVLGRRAGGIPPFLIWLVIALELGSRRAEGDTIVPGGGMGFAFLICGAFGGIAVLGFGPSLRSPRSR